MGIAMEYNHTQVGTVMIASLAIAIVAVLFPFLLAGTFYPIQGAILFILVVALVLFHSLTVEVGQSDLVCRFGTRFIKKRFLLSDIQEVRSVRNPWYSGWGIRWFPARYWLWNVSGLQAVELVLKDGKRFRIGTDEPEALILAIHKTTSLGNET